MCFAVDYICVASFVCCENGILLLNLFRVRVRVRVEARGDDRVVRVRVS